MPCFPLSPNCLSEQGTLEIRAAEKYRPKISLIIILQTFPFVKNFFQGCSNDTDFDFNVDKIIYLAYNYIATIFSCNCEV